MDHQKVETYTPLFSFLCTILVIWPVFLDSSTNFSLHFDIYGLIWLSEGVHHLQDGYFTNVQFPLGQKVGHLDSWVLFLALKIKPLWFPIESFLNLLLTIGLYTNIYFAVKSANVWGIRGISSWSAGLLFGICGLVLTSILEGAYYLCMIGWLPGLTYCLRKAMNEPRSLWLILVIICWLGCALTTAYLGLVGGFCVLVLTIHAVPRKNPIPWLIKILGPCILLGVVYSFILVSSQSARIIDPSGLTSDWDSYLNSINQLYLSDQPTMGSSNLWNLLMWSPQIDLYAHSLGPVSTIIILFSLALSPILKLGSNWQPWWIIGMFGLILSFGFKITDFELDGGIPWILYPFKDWALFSFLHFPVRLHWMTDLSGAVLFGQILHQAGKRNRLIPFLGLTLVFGQVYWAQGTLIRIPTGKYDLEPIYAQIENEGSLLDVYPVFPPLGDIDPLMIKNHLCAQQTLHHKPLLIECLGTTTENSIDWSIRNDFFNDVLGLQQINWLIALKSLGIGTIVLHTNWFSENDLQIIEQLLIKTLGSPILHTESDSIKIWSIPSPETSPQVLKENYRSWLK